MYDVVTRDIEDILDKVQLAINKYKKDVPLADISIEEIEKCFNKFKENNNG